mgnify:CR=1 FL=1
MLAEQKGDDKKSAKKLLDSDDDEDDKPKKGGKKGSDDDSGDESDGGKKKKDGKKGKEDTEEDRKAASDNHAQAMKMKQAMNQRDIGEVRNKVDNDEDDDAGSVDFKSVSLLVSARLFTRASLARFAKHRHGLFNRIFRIGDGFDESKLLSFKKSLIKKALLKMNRDLDAEAVQAFKSAIACCWLGFLIAQRNRRDVLHGRSQVE